MTTITLDTKHFDYNNIDEPLVAVPRSVLREYLQNKKKKATWVLTREDIDRSYDIAMEEIRLGKTINAEDVFKKYARV